MAATKEVEDLKSRISQLEKEVAPLKDLNTQTNKVCDEFDKDNRELTEANRKLRIIHNEGIGHFLDITNPMQAAKKMVIFLSDKKMTHKSEFAKQLYLNIFSEIKMLKDKAQTELLLLYKEGEDFH